MTDGHYFAQLIADAIREHGKIMTLKRDGETDLEVKGKRILGGAGTEDIVGSAIHQTFSVKIAPTELTASDWESKVPASNSDSIVIDGRTRSILDVKIVDDGGVTACYMLTVAG